MRARNQELQAMAEAEDRATRGEQRSPEEIISSLETGISAAVEEIRTLTGEDLKAMAQTPVVAGSEAVKEVKPRTCVIEQALPVSVIQLLQAAPHNETVRAVVLAHVKIPIPKEMVTYGDIKEWIETTIVKSPPKGTVRATLMDPDGNPVPVINNVTFDITGSEDESGTCRYSVTNTGTCSMPIPLEEFRNMMAEADSFSQLRAAVSEYIDNNWLDAIDMDADDEGYSYNHYESTDAENRDWNYDCVIESRLKQLIREHGDEDARERLS